jgi:hypothetical protein
MPRTLNKADDEKIERAYLRACPSAILNIMVIPKIFEEGRRVLEAGRKQGIEVGDTELGVRIKQFVDSL